MGLPLYNMKDIRCLYGEDPFGSKKINFDKPNIMPRPKGHVIAARITSENPDEVNLAYGCTQIHPDCKGTSPGSSVGIVSALGNGRSRVQSWAATYQIVKNGTNCSSLGIQTHGVELGLVNTVSG